MSSSDMSVAPGPVVSSDSMDTTIGFNTEVGRDTIANSSSSSGSQEFSDPTLGSTESSRPPSAHAPATARSLAPPPPLPGPSLPSAEEYSQQHRLPATATQAPLPQSTHSTPAALDPRLGGRPAQAPTCEQQTAAVADTPLQQLMIQQQQQQQQQNAQMLALMQSMIAQISSTPQAPPVRVPTPPQLAVAVRQPGAAARNPWAAPPPPPLSIAAGGFDLCARHINHICFTLNSRQ